MRRASIKMVPEPQPERPLPAVLNGPQIRQALGLKDGHFRELVDAGLLPFVRRNGRAYLAARADVEAYQQRGTAAPLTMPTEPAATVEAQKVERFVVEVAGVRLTILAEALEGALKEVNVRKGVNIRKYAY